MQKLALHGLPQKQATQATQTRTCIPFVGSPGGCCMLL
jgi:hypothetical protein